MIKSSKASIEYSNKKKLEIYHKFIKDYSKAVIFYVNHLWNNRIVFSKQNRILDIKKDLLDCPMFISTNNIEIKSSLSARTLTAAATQACGVIKTIIKEKIKLLYIKNKYISEGKVVPEWINNCLNKIKLTKPILTSIRPELSSNNIKYELNKNTSFDAFIILSSLGYKRGEKITIPIKHNRHFNKLLSQGKVMTSFGLNKKSIDVRFNIPEVAMKTTGDIVGADQRY